MKQLFIDFWSSKSFFIRSIRTVMAVGGTVLVAEQSPLPEEYRWAGYIVAGLGGALTGRDTQSGLSGGKPVKN